MPEVSKRHTPKQRIRNVLQGLNRFYPKYAIQRAADRIQSVWDANEKESSDVDKQLQDLLDFLQKAKDAKRKEADQENMPSDFGWEKTDEEIAAEKKLNKRSGQTESVVVTGKVVEPDTGGGLSVIPSSPSGQPGASTAVDAKTTAGKPVDSSKK